MMKSKKLKVVSVIVILIMFVLIYSNMAYAEGINLFDMNSNMNNPTDIYKNAKSTTTSFNQIGELFNFENNFESRIDLVVTDVSWTIDKYGKVKFMAAINNQGNSPTPSNVIHDVTFYVSGNKDINKVSWSNYYKSSISPGETVILEANSGIEGPTQLFADGTYRVWARVNESSNINEFTYVKNNWSEEKTLVVNTLENGILSKQYISDYIKEHKISDSKQQLALYKTTNQMYTNENSKIQDLKNGNILTFIFEGAGGTDTKLNYTKNTNFTEGRYGGFLIVVKYNLDAQQNEIVYTTTNVSTFPDQPKGYYCNFTSCDDGSYDYGSVPTTLEGIYQIRDTQHGSSRYPAIKILGSEVVGQTSKVVPVIRFKKKKGDEKLGFNSGEMMISTSTAINLHKGGTSKRGDVTSYLDSAHKSPNSAGCILVYPDMYNEFAKQAGFDLDENVEKNEIPNSVSGYLIIDRSFIDKERVDLVELYGKDGLLALSNKWR